MASIPLEALKAVTNNFADEYIVAKNSIVKVYKVSFSQVEEEVLIRRSTSGHPNIEMLTDIGVNNQCKHNNIVRVLGYCVTEDEEHEAIMVIKNEVNGRLDKHLSDPTLSWMQRLHICVGVARAISYLHYDFVDPYHYFHCNIKSSKILLDDKWEPKLFGFEFATTCHQNQQLSLARTYSGTVQYMDPAFEKTGGINYKSDVFSLGVVLFEVLFGRKASIVNGDKWYFAKLARRHYEERRLNDMIDPILRQQMGTQSLDIFAKTAYCCLYEQRAQRLNIKQVVTRLEEALEHQLKHESPEVLTIADQGTTFIHPKDHYSRKTSLMVEVFH